MITKIGSMVFLSLWIAGPGAAQSLLGKWKTVDDGTGEVKSVVEIREHSGKVTGKVVKLFPGPGDDPDPVCDECDEEDPRFMAKIIGMEIIEDMTWDGDELSGGNILDPEVGKVYRCRIWREGENLYVRGYWGPFFRTQVWQRYE